MKKVLAIATIVVILVSCKNEMPLQNSITIKAHVRLVGIDSTTALRTEDKILFVNIK